jgi:hypothetical protein
MRSYSTIDVQAIQGTEQSKSVHEPCSVNWAHIIIIVIGVLKSHIGDGTTSSGRWAVRAPVSGALFCKRRLACTTVRPSCSLPPPCWQKSAPLLLFPDLCYHLASPRPKLPRFHNLNKDAPSVVLSSVVQEYRQVEEKFPLSTCKF